MFKIRVLSVLAAMLLILPTWSCRQGQQPAEQGSSEQSQAAVSGDAAAKVNGREIPMSELRAGVLNIIIQNNMDAEQVDAFMGQFGPRLLEQLIQSELLYQYAQEMKYTAESEEVDKTFSELAERYADYTEFMAEMEKRGFTEDSLKASIHRQISIQKLIKETIVRAAVVPDETIREAYDQNPQKFMTPEEVEASHILIKSSEEDPQEKRDEALRKAGEIAANAREEGADFAQLAREHSEGPSAPSGGELGYFSRNRMVKPFEDAAFSMKVNEISDPVLTRFGYHIIKVTGRKEGSTAPFDEVKEKLKQDLTNRMINEMISRKLSELRAEADIEILFTPAPQNDSGENPHRLP